MKIDVDALFDKYLDDFIENNLDKYSPSQIEKMVEQIYEEFCNKPNLVLLGLSPKQYFKQMSTKELLKEFMEASEIGLSPCELLCGELETRKDAEDDLLKVVEKGNEEIATCAINILGEMNSKKALTSFIELIIGKKASIDLVEVMIEAMVKNANEIKEELLLIYDNKNPMHLLFLEVFASMSKDDRVYQILFDEYLTRKENRAEIYAYLAKYGDDRILGFLYSEVENNTLTPIELEEIKLAIEKLGGEFEDLKVKICH